MNTRFMIVTLLEPSLCLSCPFVRPGATATHEDGTKTRMMHCARMDCDNWHHEEKGAPIIYVEDRELG